MSKEKLNLGAKTLEELVAITLEGLEAMTLEELWSVHASVNAIVSARIRAEKRKLEQRLVILSRGLGGASLAGAGSPGEKPRRSYPPVQPKYRNPQTSETWSGRGKRPRWLAAAMKSGYKMEEFRIKEAVKANGRHQAAKANGRHRA
jgi:DNA-binding protein H-NS